MRKLIAAGMLSLALFLPFAAHATIAVSDTGLGTTAEQAQYDTADATGGNLPAWIGTYIIQPVLGMVGLVFFLLVLYGGLLWMTAAGNESQIKKAKDILVHSLIGAVILVTAYTITNAVFNAILSGSVTNQ